MAKCCIICALMAVAITCSTAGFAAELGMGAAALGMGGAFTAVANDQSATYWNPAGLAKMQGFHLQLPNVQAQITSTLDWRDVVDNPPTNADDRIALLQKLQSGTTSLGVSANMGVSWNNFAVFAQPLGEAELDATKVTFSGDYPTPGSKARIAGAAYAHVGIGYGTTLTDGTAVGVTLKSVTVKSFDDTITYTDNAGNYSESKVEQDESGLGMDVGYLREVKPDTDLGIAVRNLFGPSAGDVSPHRQVNIGVAHRIPAAKLLLAADVRSLFDEPTINLGVEFRPASALALRAGLYHHNLTLGVGVSILALKLDLAYCPQNTSLVSASIAF